jgi:hypothetical protein
MHSGMSFCGKEKDRYGIESYSLLQKGVWP